VVAPAAPPAPAIEVKLLDAGSEPRAPLRYRISAGQPERLVVELSTELKLSIGDMSDQVRSPTVRVTLEVRARAARPLVSLEGKVVAVEVPEDPGLPPAMVKAVRSDLERLSGLSFRAAFTERGLLDRIELPVPADANAQLLTTLDQVRDGLRLLLVPLPEAPVGTNARWQTARSTTIASARVEATTIFTLGAPAAGKRSLAMAVALVAREQPLTLPRMPPGSTVTLAALEGKGRGQIDLELARIVQPSALSWSASGQGTARAANDPPSPMTLTIDSMVNVRRR
jgi:hypothetical protein